jgi:hypothetical protein
MRDNPTGRSNSETVCSNPGCGLVAGHTVPCRREQDEGEYAALDENGEDSSGASKGCGLGTGKIVKKSQLKHGRAQAGRLAL